MGLLDTLNTLGIETPDDPMKQQALQRGLLSFGLGLMASKGRLGPAMGQAGLLGMQAYGQDLKSQQAQQAQELGQQAVRLQNEQLQRDVDRRKRLDALPGQFSQGESFDKAGYGRALMGVDPAAGLNWQQATERPKTITLKGDEKILDATTFKPLAQGAPKLPEAVQGYNFAVGQGYKGTFEDWTLAQRQAGAMNVSMGTPVPVSLGDGRKGFVQPANKPGAPPTLMVLPDGTMPAPVKEPMSAAMQAELFQADEVAQSGKSSIGMLDKALDLNKNAYSGYGAATRATLVSNIPGVVSEKANTTIELDNLIQQEALSSLRSIFGGNPTEGERKILLDLQASSSKTPEQRATILKNARDAAQRRVEFNERKAESIRSGSYLSDGVKKPSIASGPLSEARAAIARGAPREAVIQRLRDAGIDASGL